MFRQRIQPMGGNALKRNAAHRQAHPRGERWPGALFRCGRILLLAPRRRADRDPEGERASRRQRAPSTVPCRPCLQDHLQNETREHNPRCTTPDDQFASKSQWHICTPRGFCGADASLILISSEASAQARRKGRSSKGSACHNPHLPPSRRVRTHPPSRRKRRCWLPPCLPLPKLRCLRP
jgi:hypothetical protein